MSDNPDQEALDRRAKFAGLTDDEKEALKLYWNNRIAIHCGGSEKLRQRWAAQQARRALRGRFRR